MEILGKERNIKLFLYQKCLPALIIFDLFLITISIIFEIPQRVLWDIQFFDWVVCIILLGEYFLNLYLSSPKKDFILDKENIIGLIASIPFDLIITYILHIPISVAFLRYLRIFKLIRVFNLSKFEFIRSLFEKTSMHKILAGLFITIAFFTLLFNFIGPEFKGLDGFYYVIVTLTTVGYGDFYPHTHNEKVLAIILILIGIFVFSTITAAMSSFLTDRILEDDEEDIKDEITKIVEQKSENIMNELNVVREENRRLHDEIAELKEMMENQQ